VSTDVIYLAWTALLTGLLWIPYIVCQIAANGPLTPGNFADPTPRSVPDWGKRAYRAHQNAVEAFAPFATLVFAAHLAGKADHWTVIWAGVFFWARLAHAVVFLLGVPHLRTILFSIGSVAIVGLFWNVIH